MSENPAEIMRLPQTAFIADGLYLFVGKAEHIFCLRDSPVHQVAADTDTKLLPEHAGQIVEYSNAIVHAFQGFRAPFSGKIVHIFTEQSAAFN